MKTILVDAWNTLFVEEGGESVINEEMKELLNSFENRKIVLTNANDEQMIKFGIDKSPYEVFTLKHNPDKIDPIFYKKMLEKFNLKSEDVIYFEHNLEAIESARKNGILTHPYNKNKKDLVELKEFLENNL